MYIAVEGCIGVGKTTFATKLAEFRNAIFLEEDFGKNPFLMDFYANPDKSVLETEFTFLLIHFHQLRSAALHKTTDLISDFLFAKDLIYADVNFSDVIEKVIFQGLHALLSAKIRVPDIVLFLSASDELIAERIRKRNRQFEVQINFDYYRKINAAYEMFFQQYNQVPVLTVRADTFDFFRDVSLLRNLSLTMNRMTAEGIMRCTYLEDKI